MSGPGYDDDDEDEDEFDFDDFGSSADDLPVLSRNEVRGVPQEVSTNVTAKSKKTTAKSKTGKTPKPVSFQLSRKKLMRISDGLSDDDQTMIYDKDDAAPPKAKTLTLKLEEISPDLACQLAKWKDLPEKVRKAIASMIPDVDPATIEQTKINSPRDFANVFTAYMKKVGETAQTLETKINGRYYPFFAQVQYYQSMFGTGCSISGNFRLADQGKNVYHSVHDSDFEDSMGNHVSLTLGEILARLELRLNRTAPEEYKKRLAAARTLALQTGKVLVVKGRGLLHAGYSWWSRLEEAVLGSPESPQKVIIESELETQEGRHGNTNVGNWYEQQNSTPFVRAFSLDRKEYVYLDVEDFSEYDWDEKALDKLVLPGKHLNILRSVFQADVKKLFGDLVKGKHGGMIVLANGTPGVGKTMTAEVFAEHSKRPLYTMEIGELGTNLNHVEQNLQRIFHRASRWNAVLLFDEADIFLQERGQDLERSAIVGVFLRLLDYYPGMLFLTTNRANTIDPAFKSRITLRLDYPELSEEIRGKIWNLMLDAAGMVSSDGIGDVANRPLNGRQVRNAVRLLKVAFPDGKINAQAISDVCDFTCK